MHRTTLKPPGDEKADEWAKIAADEPDTRGVEWLRDRGRARCRSLDLLRASSERSRRKSGQRHGSGREAGLLKDIQDAGKLEARRHGGWEH